MSVKDSIRWHIKNGTAPVRADVSVPDDRFALRQDERLVAQGKLTDKALPTTAGRVVCVSPAIYFLLGGK